MQVNILEAKNRLSRLIKAAQAGEDVVIANRGQPVVRLVAATMSPVADPVSASGRSLLDWLGRHRLPDYARRSGSEIDIAIAAERSAWD